MLLRRLATTLLAECLTMSTAPTPHQPHAGIGVALGSDNVDAATGALQSSPPSVIP